jgi:NADH-quinone oxidoreductase subunit K
MITLTYYLILGTLLFFIGISGTLTQKNFIKFLMCVEIAINGVNLNLAAIASFMADASGQTLVMFIKAFSAAELQSDWHWQ